MLININSLLCCLILSPLLMQSEVLKEEGVENRAWAMQAWWPWSPEKEPDEPVPAPNFNILDLETNLSQKIIGQKQALKMSVDALLCHYAGIQDPSKPIAAFLYIGPTGVGKTELAKELARQLFHDEVRLLRFDMSEYKGEEGLNRLIGMPHGYKGSEEGGILSNAILKQPHSIVLLDEIEKSNSTVYSLFLHIFDEGYFTSATGQYVDCRDCLFIATTNIGSKTILAQHPFSYEKALYSVEPELIKALSPEFYNRIEPVVFHGLTPEMVESIVRLKLNALADNVFKQKKVMIHFDESVVQYVQAKGYHEQLGARPLQRVIKYDLTSAIAKAFLNALYEPGDCMRISYAGSECVVSKEKDEPL